jgi:acetylornithine deacetylase/succinyl-diaminopimelate desuccinylase-like protein
MNHKAIVTLHPVMQYIEQHLASYKRLKEELVAHFLSPTRTYTAEPAMIERLRNLLQQYGLYPQVLDTTASSLVVHLNTTNGPPLLLYSHFDGASPHPRQLQTIAVYLAAFDVYRQMPEALPVQLVWLLDGSQDAEATLHALLARYPELQHADGCIWDGTGQTGIDEESLPQLALGCKGLLRVELEVQTAKKPVHSMHRAIVPDAFWQLIWALRSIKDAREEIHLTGFYDAVTPVDDHEVAALYQLPDIAPQLAQQWGLPHLLLNLHGFQQHYVHLLTPTCAIVTIQGGEAIHSTHGIDPRDAQFMPTSVRAVLDFLLVPDQDPYTIFAALQQHLRNQGFGEMTARLLFARFPAHTAADHPFVQCVRHCSTLLYGNTLAELPLTAGSLPMASLQHTYSIPSMLLTPGYAPLFVRSIQQLVLLIGGLADATHST